MSINLCHIQATSLKRYNPSLSFFLSFFISPVQPHTAIIGDVISPPFIVVAHKTQSFYLVSVISDGNTNNTTITNKVFRLDIRFYRATKVFFFFYSLRLFVSDQFSVAYFQLFEWFMCPVSSDYRRCCMKLS